MNIEDMRSAVQESLSSINFSGDMPTPDELENLNASINDLLEEWGFNGHVLYDEDGVSIDSVEIYIDPHTNELQIEYNTL